MPAPEAVTVDLLACRPELLHAVGEMRWREWGYGDPSPAGHVEEAGRLVRKLGISPMPQPAVRSRICA